MITRILHRATLFAAALGLTASAAAQPAPQAPQVCPGCVKTHMEHLAGDALRGRGCGTADEHAASVYIEQELRRVGIQPAFANGMRQAVELETPQLAAPATLKVSAPDAAASFREGVDFVLLGDPKPVQGRLVRVTSPEGAHDVAGAIVFVDHPGASRAEIRDLTHAGAVAVLTPASPAQAADWKKLVASVRPPSRVLGVENEPSSGARVLLSKTMADALRRRPDGTSVSLDVRFGPPERRTTYNVVGVLHGTDPEADRHALLLSAHYDHLGVRNGVIYHGADDDASGTSAVLEFARILGQGGRPRRTVYFALFGCEEEGGLGAVYFRANPPGGSLSNLAMNLEFEMIGNDDPKRPGVLMLTGWERSNLGPTLAAHGAHIGPDLYPEQNFFQRSDNYALALKGVVAQTVSAWPVPPSYHDPSDTLDHIDFAFMDQAIGSMIGPVRWLADSDFQPEWSPGKKP